MNGRIYDPLLGRFLSADLKVTNPSNLQSYNRYSYVRNNPLSLTDPSGFAESDAEKKAREAREEAARKKASDQVRSDAREKLGLQGYLANWGNIETQASAAGNAAVRAADSSQTATTPTPNRIADNDVKPGDGSQIPTVHTREDIPTVRTRKDDIPTVHTARASTGGQRLLKGAGAAVGIVANGAGVVAAAGLEALPEPTMLTKVAGTALLIKTGYGVGANFANLLAAIRGTEAPSSGALFNDVASVVMPGNETAQKLATVGDLATDFSAGPITRNAIKGAVGEFEKMPAASRAFVRDPAELGNTVNAFQILDVSKTGAEAMNQK